MTCRSPSGLDSPRESSKAEWRDEEDQNGSSDQEDEADTGSFTTGAEKPSEGVIIFKRRPHRVTSGSYHNFKKAQV